MNGPLVCPGPVEQWLPLTVPAGNPVWQAARCYEHTDSIVGGTILTVAGLLFVLAVVLSWWSDRSRW